MTRTSLPLQPVAIALETITFAKRTDDLKLSGIDLESGRRVKVRVQFFDHTPSTVDPLSDLILLLSMQRLTR